MYYMGFALINLVSKLTDVLRVICAFMLLTLQNYNWVSEMRDPHEEKNTSASLIWICTDSKISTHNFSLKSTFGSWKLFRDYFKRPDPEIFKSTAAYTQLRHQNNANPTKQFITIHSNRSSVVINGAIAVTHIVLQQMDRLPH